MGRAFRTLVAAFSFLFLVSLSAAAQDLPDVAQGFQPYTAYKGGMLDQVNASNGSLTVAIPLVSYPQKGALSLSYSLIFNSFGFQDMVLCNAAAPGDQVIVRSGCHSQIQFIPLGIPGLFPRGPRFIMDQALTAGGVLAPNGSTLTNPPLDARFYVITADNAQHPLAQTSLGYQSVDGAGYRFAPTQAPDSGNGNIGIPDNSYPGDMAWKMTTAPGTILDSHGVTHSATGMLDVDGNAIAFNSDGTVLDSANRTIPVWTTAPTSACPVLSAAQYQPLSGAAYWTPPGPNGSVTYLFCYVSVNIHTHFPVVSNGAPQDSLQVHDSNEQMLQSVTLPNGTYWGFIYDSADPNGSPTGAYGNTGQLTTMIYPTGGSVSYTYEFTDGSCNSSRVTGLNPNGVSFVMYRPQILTRTMKDAQGNVLGTWQYGPGTTISPTGELTQDYFGAGGTCGLVDLGQDVYAGGTATGTPLKSVRKTYNNNGAPGTPEVDVAAKKLIGVTTTLDDGSVSTETIQYGSAANVTFSSTACDSHGNNCSAGSDTVSLPLGGPTLTITRGYDNSILKQEGTNYLWSSNSNYYNQNLITLPSSTYVLDGTGNTEGSGTTVSSTSYSYDESTYSSAGAHSGHVTTATPYLDLTSGPTPVTHTGWTADGEKSYVIDADAHLNANGHTADYTHGACNGSVVTGTTNALDQSISGTYDCNTGLLTSLTDANGGVTTVAWDSMLRIASVTSPLVPVPGSSPASPTATFTYCDVVGSGCATRNKVTKTVAAAPNPNQTTTVQFDDFGRELTRSTTDPNGDDIVAKSYDADGRVSTVSNPYRSGDTLLNTTTTYDALGRPLTVMHPDGNSVTTSYSGPAVDSYDETGVHMRHTSDALGQLVQVLELGTTTQPLSLETDYTYNTLGNLTYVNQQGASGDSARTRSFSYDSLSRLVTSQNPETGTICYGTWISGICTTGYDGNGNLVHKTDARNITVNYAYDNLNRLVAKTYSGDTQNTPNSCYQYGGTSDTGFVGRLMAEWTILGSCASTAPSSGYLTRESIQTYDPAGRVLDEAQLLSLNGGGSQSFPLHWGYDLSSALVSGYNGMPSGDANARTFSYGYDAAAHLTTVSSALSSSPGTVTKLLDASASGSYSAIGLVAAGLSYDPTTNVAAMTLSKTYDTNRLWPTSETYLGPTRSLGGNPSSGSISFSGQEASYNNPATSSSTVITVTGSEGTHQLCQFRRNVWVCTDIPDTGSITVTVNGFPATATFADGTTDEDLVSQFATGFTQTGSPVTAFASSNMVVLASVATGSAANYPLSISASGMSDFTAGDPDSAMTGGTDGHTGSDTGTMTVSINGTSIGSVSWGASDTATTLASGVSGLIHTAQPSWTVSSSGSTISLQSSAGANVPVTVSVADTAGNTASFSAAASGLSGGNGPTGSTNVVYSYGMPAGSYAANGNILSYNDSVNGNWSSITYDGLNRLTGASVSPVAASSQVFCWNYDAFGNRLAQGVAATDPNQSCAPGTAWTLSPVTYDPNNRITTTSFVQTVPSGAYDASGNLGMDVVPSPSGTSNLYSYDAEDRICASQAGSVLTQYIYDAEGHRVAKGTVNAVYIYDPQTQTNKLSCNVSANGFSETYAYVLGHSGEQMTEIKSGQWQHTNLDVTGALLATYDVKGLHYQISDWLGSRRVQTDPTGAIEETCTNQPFGDNLQCVTPSGAPVTADDATEHHFTNKERDVESGLDFFGARYYAGGMGRFMNPDWVDKPEEVPYAKIENPQTLNLYGYVKNNPLSLTDPDGHDDDEGDPPQSVMTPAPPAPGTAPYPGNPSPTEVSISVGTTASETEAATGVTAVVEEGAGILLSPVIAPIAGGAVLFGGSATAHAPTLKPKPNVSDGNPLPKLDPFAPMVLRPLPQPLGAEHKKNARPSTKDKHETVRPGTSPPPNYKPDRKYKQPK
ncbi:MAG TPA: RHS repeat-associated core domain-containing protein, partial [Acidobacteriaceae bacterium]